MYSRLVACCVFLLLLLPLQMGWAGVHATAMQTGAQAAAGMVATHCRHAEPADNAATGTSLTQSQPQADHGHCGTCHGAIALTTEAPHHFAAAPFAPVPGCSRLPASQPAGLPDRPQWAPRA